MRKGATARTGLSREAARLPHRRGRRGARSRLCCRTDPADLASYREAGTGSTDCHASGFSKIILYFKQVRLGSELFLRMFFVTLTHSRVHKYRGPRKDAGGRRLSDSPPPTRQAARSTWHSASRPTSVIAPRCVSWAPELGMTVTDECWLRTTPTGFEIFL